MELIIVRGIKRGSRIAMLRVNTTEAVRLIHSLTEQILQQSPNTGRWENYCQDGTDFSIAVHHAPLERVSL